MAVQGVTELVHAIEAFRAESWSGEPIDVSRLRDFSLPPMGNLPCVIYCNFDLFWAGEQLQVCREAALAEQLDPPVTARAASALLERVAIRTGKWGMVETVGLLNVAAETLRSWEPKSPAEFADVIEQLMLALNRIQAAVDAIIPWSDLDKNLHLRASP